MKRLLVSLTGLLVSTTLLTPNPVEAGIGDSVSNYLFKRKAFQVVESYTENTVLKTLASLTDHIGQLHQAAGKLAAAPNADNLNTAILSWKNVQADFNKSQIFMFGPAAHYDFHKQLAIWPTDKVLVDHALVEMQAGKMVIDAKSLREKTASMRGLNAVKYFLFENGRPRDVTKLTPHELQYITAVTEVMLWEGLDFEAAWIGTDRLPADKRAILDKAGIKKRAAYAEEFKNPGEPSSRYASVSVPLQELIQESSTVIDDMMPQIEGLTADDEGKRHNYWQTLDPYADLLDKLQGVENSYLGGVRGSRGPSFSQLVAEKDQVLDERIKAAFAHVEQRLEVARRLQNGPREQHELAVKIVAAECKKLSAQLMTATPLVAADPAVGPFAAYGSNL